MQSRIQDLQRQQLVAQTALASRPGNSVPQRMTPRNLNNLVRAVRRTGPEEDPIQVERKRRAYVSLFS